MTTLQAVKKKSAAPQPAVKAPAPAASGAPGRALDLQRRAGNQATGAALGGNTGAPAPVLPGASERRYTLKLKIGSSEWVRAEQTAEQALISLGHARRRLYAEIRDGIDTQLDLGRIREEQLITARISSLLGGVSFPDVDIWDAGLAALDRANAEIRSGRIDTSVPRLQEAAVNISGAKRKLTEYREGSISGAERAEVGLEVIQTSAAVTLSIGTGGLAGVAVGAGYGAAQMTARQKSEVALGLRKEIDWEAITFDTLFGLVTGMLGGKLGEKLLKGLLKNPAAASLGRKALSHLVSELLSGRVSTILQTVGRQIFDHVRGKEKMTAEGFLDAIVATLTDPKQMFLDLLLGAAQRRSAAAMAKRKTSAGTTSGAGRPGGQKTQDVPADTAGQANLAKPVSAEPAPPAQAKSLAGTLAAPPAPKASLPDGATPAKDASSASKLAETQVDDPKVTSAHFGDVRKHLEGVPEGKGPVVGQKLGGLTEVANPQPKPAPREKKSAQDRRAEEVLVGRMRAQRRAEGIRKLKDPTLQAVVEHSAKKKETFGDKKTTLQDMAADSPELISDLWQKWKVGKPKGDIKSNTFKEYVQRVMTGGRGKVGEDTLAFKTGPGEIMVKAPKASATAPGSDMLTYRQADDKVVYYDNKAFGKGAKVGKVSALEWNLLKNMSDDIKDLRLDASKGRASPGLTKFVLPKLRAALADLKAYDKARLNQDKNRPWIRKRQLASMKHQKAVDAILKKHRIERVVSTEGGALDVTITDKLAGKGFEQD